MSEQSSSSMQLNDEEIDILENDYDRYGFILIVKFVLCFFSHHGSLSLLHTKFILLKIYKKFSIVKKSMRMEI